MQDNEKKCLELANRIYDLDAEVYKCVGSALGRTSPETEKVPWRICVC